MDILLSKYKSFERNNNVEFKIILNPTNLKISIYKGSLLKQRQRHMNEFSRQSKK